MVRFMTFIISFLLLFLHIQAQSVLVSRTNVTINKPGSYNVTCEAVGFNSSINMQWFSKSGFDHIPSISSNRVFQSISNSTAVLHIVDAYYADEGFYFCSETWGNVTHNTTVYIAVPSKPSIKLIETVSCNGNVTVHWEPHANAVGLRHKIEAFNSSNNLVSSKFISANATTRVVSLPLIQFGEFNITMTPCLNDLCSVQYLTWENIITSSPDPDPQNVNLTQQPLNDTCTLLWSPSKIIDETFRTTYEIKVRSTTARISPRMNRTTNATLLSKNLSSDSIQYQFSTMPNTEYSVQIRGSACYEWGNIRHPTGKCISNAAAPTFVPSPVISKSMNYDVTRNITLTIPNEDNGPISCLIVIVTPGKIDFVPLPLNLDILSSDGESENEDSYIAAALDVTNSTKRQYHFKLGSGSHSLCNLSYMGNPNAIWNGQNKKIARNDWYSVYLVSVSGNNITKASNVSTFEHTLNVQNNSWIIQACIGAVIVFFILLVIILCRCKKSQKKKQVDNTTQSEGLSNYSTLPRTLPRGKTAQQRCKINPESTEISTSKPDTVSYHASSHLISSQNSNLTQKQQNSPPKQTAVEISRTNLIALKNQDQVSDATLRTRSKSIDTTLVGEVASDGPADVDYESISKRDVRSQSVDVAEFLTSTEKSVEYQTMATTEEENNLGVNDAGYLTPIETKKLFAYTADAADLFTSVNSSSKYQIEQASKDDNMVPVDEIGYLTPMDTNKLSKIEKNDSASKQQSNDVVYENTMSQLDPAYATIEYNEAMLNDSKRIYVNTDNDEEVFVKSAYDSVINHETKIKDVTYEDMRRKTPESKTVSSSDTSTMV
ncbi:uncharacterized protein LOC120347240 isoform X2 [Styela clava]